jgi:hypothetical protein
MEKKSVIVSKKVSKKSENQFENKTCNTGQE